MLKRRIFLFIVCFAVLSVSAVPAMGLFHFGVHRLDMAFNGDIFVAVSELDSVVTLTRDVDPVKTIVCDETFYHGLFELEMDLDNITSDTATATGEFTITDVDGDTIDGGITGSWALLEGTPYFYGTLSDVQWRTDDGVFDNGEGDTLSLTFPSDPPPWIGAAIGLTTSDSPWFSSAWTETKTGGGINAWVVPVPTPTSLLLGILGAVGVRLRRFA